MKENSIIAKSVNLLIESGMVDKRDFIGCSEDEIDEIERQFSIKLPLIYREYLNTMGRSSGSFLQGTDFSFPVILGLRESAEDLIKECDAKITLSKTDFVFVFHQGYQFLYFNSKDSDDPPIYLFVDEEPISQKVFNKFSEWLIQCVKDETEAFRDLNKLRT